jgi:hypothetical protein
VTEHQKRPAPRSPASLPEFRLEGREYNLTEAQKAVRIGISPSWLQKDRLREQPQIDFARIGNTVRYSPEPPPPRR